MENVIEIWFEEVSLLFPRCSFVFASLCFFLLLFILFQLCLALVYMPNAIYPALDSTHS